MIKIKVPVVFCHWNNASTSASLSTASLLPCKMPFIPNNYSLVLGFCPVPCCGGLAACIQLLLYEWQPIKALDFCWRHHHHVIPLQGSMLLAMKPTTKRALKTQTQTLVILPLGSSNISSDILLTETIVTVISCIASVGLRTPPPTQEHNSDR